MVSNLPILEQRRRVSADRTGVELLAHAEHRARRHQASEFAGAYARRKSTISHVGLAHTTLRASS